MFHDADWSCPANEVLVSALKSGYGIAAISRYVVAAELASGALAVIPVRGCNVRNVVSGLRVGDAKLTPSADPLLACARRRLADLTGQRRRRQT